MRQLGVLKNHGCGVLDIGLEQSRHKGVRNLHKGAIHLKPLVPCVAIKAAQGLAECWMIPMSSIVSNSPLAEAS